MVDPIALTSSTVVNVYQGRNTWQKNYIIAVRKKKKTKKRYRHNVNIKVTPANNLFVSFRFVLFFE